MAELIPIPFPTLLKRMFYEHRSNGSIFDLPARKFCHPGANVDMSVSFCGNSAANPVGPAAGPQTQLAQNIVLSWLAGSRIIELKTVQRNDRLKLTRPCIDMATVGYNTEWSQELQLDESLREYVKASMIIEILKEWLRAPRGGMAPAAPISGPEFEEKQGLKTANFDTIFDISVGYDLAGIQSAEIRGWLQTMRNASALIEEYRKEIPSEFAAYRDLPFTTEIANSITLSTFHGTPADEIEKICEFLLAEMDFHVIIKMNPPMLGKARIDHLLYEKLGYTDIEVNEKVYETNITFPDAVGVARRLENVAGRHGKTIGVKFGNTLEVVNTKNFLRDRIQYLSGRPLHILHLALVDEWRKMFGGGFPVSFSAGIDANNFADCVATGLVPITTCTDLLRPGGYGRLPQYLSNLERAMNNLGAASINKFILKSAQITNKAPHVSNLHEAILINTSELLRRSIDNPRYKRSENSRLPQKIGRHLRLWDCINCDKCIPVCPNDANFAFEIEPFEKIFSNIEIVNGSWRTIKGGVLKVQETHQIANFADACNDCGNCDVFCPEDGGPYLEKPRFFGSIESWNRWKPLNGFLLTNDGGVAVLRGRFNDDEYELRWGNQHGIRFQAGSCSMIIDPGTDEIINVETSPLKDPTTVNMEHYFIMKTLLKGMIDKSHIHFVNIGLVN